MQVMRTLVGVQVIELRASRGSPTEDLGGDSVGEGVAFRAQVLFQGFDFGAERRLGMDYRGVGLGARYLHAGRAVVLQFAAQLFHFLICLGTSRAESRFVKIAEHLDEYRDVERFDFLQHLVESPEFRDEAD